MHEEARVSLMPACLQVGWLVVVASAGGVVNDPRVAAKLSPEDAWNTLVVQALASYRHGGPPPDVRLPAGTVLKATHPVLLTAAHSGAAIRGAVRGDGAPLVQLVCSGRMQAVFNITG